MDMLYNWWEPPRADVTARATNKQQRSLRPPFTSSMFTKRPCHAYQSPIAPGGWGERALTLSLKNNSVACRDVV